MNKAAKRDIRLDLIKALAIALVLLWHLQPIQIPATDATPLFLRLLRFGLAQFNMQITLLAVPLFLLASLYLFWKHMEARPAGYAGKRFRRLGGIFLFWTVCQLACFYGVQVIRSIRGTGNISPPEIPAYRLLLEGGPPLPIVGDSVFYFLCVLLILVSVSATSLALRKTGKLLDPLGTAVIILSIAYFEILNLKGHGLPSWRIDNYLLYMPLSHVLLRHGEKKLARYIPLFCLGFVVFSAQDIYLRHLGHRCGPYSRVSVVLGAAALFSAILQLNKLKEFRPVTFLSKYSLGIFATHKYWQLIMIAVFHYLGFSASGHRGSIGFDWHSLVLALLVAAVTFLGVLLAGRTPIRRFLA